MTATANLISRTCFVRASLFQLHNGSLARNPFRPSALQSPRRSFTNTAFVEYMSSTALVRGCEKALITIHETCGTPWWATILITVVTLRGLITVPLAAVQRRISAKVMSLKPQMDQIAAEVAQGIRVQKNAKNWSELQATVAFRRKMREERREMWIKHNSHPAKAFLLPWFQIPLWIGLSFGLRNLCGGWAHLNSQTAREDFHHGGLSWFRDMTVPDPTFALPLLYGLTNILITELWIAGIPVKRNLLLKIGIWVGRVAAVVFVPIAAAMPAAISYYWMVSSMFGLFQLFLFMSPRAMRLLRIPILNKDVTPYRTLIRKLLRRSEIAAASSKML